MCVFFFGDFSFHEFLMRDRVSCYCSHTDDTLCPCVFYEFHECDSESISFIVEDKSFIGCIHIKQILESKDDLPKMPFKL